MHIHVCDDAAIDGVNDGAGSTWSVGAVCEQGAPC